MLNWSHSNNKRAAQFSKNYIGTGTLNIYIYIFFPNNSPLFCTQLCKALNIYIQYDIYFTAQPKDLFYFNRCKIIFIFLYFIFYYKAPSFTHQQKIEKKNCKTYFYQLNIIADEFDVCISIYMSVVYLFLLLYQEKLLLLLLHDESEYIAYVFRIIITRE